MAVSANLWHPLAFNARTYGLRRTVAPSLFSHTCGALPPPRILGAIDTRSPNTHPPTHRRSVLFHFHHAASIMAANSSSCIGTIPLGDSNSHSNLTTPPTVTVSAPPADKLNSAAGTSAARPASPNAPAHPRSKAYAQGTVCSALGSVPGAVTGAVGRPLEIAGVGTRRRHRRRQESLLRHIVSESARSVADCRPTFDTCRSSESWMWLS